MVKQTSKDIKESVKGMEADIRVDNDLMKNSTISGIKRNNIFQTSNNSLIWLMLLYIF